MNNSQELGQALVKECHKRLFDESLPRIRKCLARLSEEEVWQRPNENTVSVGNLVLHLCGNVRQWIISGLGGAEDRRDRPLEFSEVGPISTTELLERLEGTMKEAGKILDGLEMETLLEERRVQGFDETGLSILIQVVEHFSYHTGQITYYVKSCKNIDLEYYSGIDLNDTE